MTNVVIVSAARTGVGKSEVAKKGVTVNTISPGYLATRMVMAVPQEIMDIKSCRKFLSVVLANRKRSQPWCYTCARMMAAS
ncbi:hypothetical protein LMG29542_04891 [Paraburkholderia humisilvae]|uniref:3-oxoacyl-[acyl-carrier-protein] reductase FabG n=1 Tax=Paraburkholderia humisilvae TaxID=627669 RepID=A0A6J5EGU6_9BURK|nr:hypothetical protein LMG29542_04891 [Paraburkholderia humisilvae]